MKKLEYQPICKKCLRKLKCRLTIKKVKNLTWCYKYKPCLT